MICPKFKQHLHSFNIIGTRCFVEWGAAILWIGDIRVGPGLVGGLLHQLTTHTDLKQAPGNVSFGCIVQSTPSCIVGQLKIYALMREVNKPLLTSAFANEFLHQVKITVYCGSNKTRLPQSVKHMRIVSLNSSRCALPIGAVDTSLNHKVLGQIVLLLRLLGF